jgi:hypothetical protein
MKELEVMEHKRLAYFGCINKAKYEFKEIFGTFSDEEKKLIARVIKRPSTRDYVFFGDRRMTKEDFVFYFSKKSSRFKNGISALIADARMVWFDRDFEKVIKENPIIRENFD